MLAKITSFLLWALVSLWSRTLRIRLLNRPVNVGASEEGKTVIYAFWHDSVFLLPHAHPDKNIDIMVSESRDGETAALTLCRFGFSVVRGSSKRKGSRALIGLISRVRQGRSVALTVDGPRGPRHRSKEGAIYLAGKLQVPIVPVATWAQHCWILERTWDQFVVPTPFTGSVVLYGYPIRVNDTSSDEIEAKRRELDAVLERMKEQAARAGACRAMQPSIRSKWSAKGLRRAS